MDQTRLEENSLLLNKDNLESSYVPSLQLTKGQPKPIAANGGLSFMSFEKDGDAGEYPAA